jgi:hypothetical protein
VKLKYTKLIGFVSEARHPVHSESDVCSLAYDLQPSTSPLHNKSNQLSNQICYGANNSIMQLSPIQRFGDVLETGQPAQRYTPLTYAKNNLGKGSRLATCLKSGAKIFSFESILHLSKA